MSKVIFHANFILQGGHKTFWDFLWKICPKKSQIVSFFGPPSINLFTNILFLHTNILFKSTLLIFHNGVMYLLFGISNNTEERFGIENDEQLWYHSDGYGNVVTCYWKDTEKVWIGQARKLPLLFDTSNRRLRNCLMFIFTMAKLEKFKFWKTLFLHLRI